MKVTVNVEAVREVTEVTTHEFELPYYGQEPKTGAVVSLVPVMYTHLPDRLEKVMVAEISTKRDALRIKQTSLKSYPKVSPTVASLIARYPIQIPASRFEEVQLGASVRVKTL
jgi:hypothetical protein